MSRLKRCPFCGDEVEILPTGLYHWKYAIHHKTENSSEEPNNSERSSDA